MIVRSYVRLPEGNHSYIVNDLRRACKLADLYANLARVPLT